MTASFELEGFEPMSRLGGGGFGDVWLARQTNVDRQVAIKVGHAPIQDETIRLRFDRECKALGRLSGHPNIVDVYTAGSLNDGRPYLVLEYIGGGTLWQRLKKTPIAETELRDLARQMAAALSEAHSSGVLHRDLKPENILIRSTGEAVLGDFGIARLQDGVNTTSAAITASVAYAAPEILSGKRATVASDLYGIGVCLLAAVHRSVPFVKKNDESIHPIINRVMSEAPPDVRSRGLSEEFAQIVDSLLSKEPANRPVSATDLLDQLAALPPIRPAEAPGDDVTVVATDPTGDRGSGQPEAPAAELLPEPGDTIAAPTRPPARSTVAQAPGALAGIDSPPSSAVHTPNPGLRQARTTGATTGNVSVAMLPGSVPVPERVTTAGRSDLKLFALAYLTTIVIGGIALYLFAESRNDDSATTEAGATAFGAVPLTDDDNRSLEMSGADATSAGSDQAVALPAPPLGPSDLSFGDPDEVSDEAPGPGSETLCGNAPATIGLVDWTGNVISAVDDDQVLYQVISRFETSVQAQAYLNAYADTNDCSSWTVSSADGDQQVRYAAEPATEAGVGDRSYRFDTVGDVDGEPVVNATIVLVRLDADVLTLSLSAESADSVDELDLLVPLAVDRLTGDS